MQEDLRSRGAVRPRGGGQALLVRREDGPTRRPRWVDVDSDHVNSYIRDRSRVEGSAKEFRTWNATVLAAVPGVWGIPSPGKPT